MIRKLIRIGNSLAVTLPADELREAGFKEGTRLRLTYDYRSKSFTVAKPDAETQDTFLGRLFS